MGRFWGAANYLKKVQDITDELHELTEIYQKGFNTGKKCHLKID